MELPITISKLRGILDLVLEGKPPSDSELSRALDELAVAFHDCPPGSPAEDAPPSPPSDHGELYADIGARFPGYGYYALSDPTEVLDGEPSVGDAIDDLADIVRDLREISWRYDVLGADDAHWHFRLLFQIHWGEHLRSLALYLHSKQFG
jgi:hypothetical protein